MAPSTDPGRRDDATPPAGGDAVIAALQAEITLLRAENSALAERLAELERRLGLNSSNSGKPSHRQAMGCGSPGESHLEFS